MKKSSSRPASLAEAPGSAPTPKREVPECPECGGHLTNHGAESHGDGDIYDALSCDECHARFEWHATYCKCGCGGGRWENVSGPEDPWDY